MTWPGGGTYAVELKGLEPSTSCVQIKIGPASRLGHMHSDLHKRLAWRFRVYLEMSLILRP